VLTTRSGTTANRFPGGQRLRLPQDEPAGHNDVLDYISLRLRGTGITDSVPAAREIAAAAARNFLYASQAVTEFLVRPDAGIPVLPAGLAALYQESISRLVAADSGRLPKAIRQVLGLLVQSRGDGFTPAQMTRFSGLSLPDVEDALRTCAPYLLGGFPDGPFLPFHEALREYLRSSQLHHVYPAQATERIVSVLSADPADPHAVAHLLGYLTDGYLLAKGDEIHSARQATEAILTDSRYLHARLAAKGIDSLLAEIAALRCAVKDSEIAETLHGVLGRQAHNLRHWDHRKSPAFALQQIRYDCLYTGRPGMIAERDVEPGTTISVNWSITGGNTLLPARTLAADGVHAHSVAVSPDGTKAGVWSFDGNIRVHEIANGAMVLRLPCRGLGRVGFSRDSQDVIVEKYGSGFISWEIATRAKRETVLAEDIQFFRVGREKPKLPAYIGTTDEPGFTAITPDGRYAAVLAREHERDSVALWDLQRRETIGVYWGEHFNSVSITPDGRQVILGSFSGEPRILTPASRSPHATTGGHCGPVTAAALYGGQAVTIERDGILKGWDIRTGRHLYSAKVPHSVTAVAVCRKGQYSVLGSFNGDVVIFDLKFQYVVRKLLVDGDPSDEAWRTRDGARDRALPLVGVSGCEPMDWAEEVNHRHGSPVSAVDIAPDGRLVATGTLNGVLRIWHLPSGDLLRELSRDGHQVVAVRFTSDGQEIVTVTAGGSTQIWNVASGKVVHELHPGHTRNHWPVHDCFYPAAITRDGNFLASAARDGKVILYDLAKRREAAQLVVHGRITALDIEGGDLAVGTGNGELLLAAFVLPKHLDITGVARLPDYGVTSTKIERAERLSGLVI
jgi:WD40 repeat protein